MGFAEQSLILGVLPRDELLDEAMQALALAALILFRWEAVRVGRWIIDQLREQHGTSSGKGSARPPQMEG